MKLLSTVFLLAAALAPISIKGSFLREGSDQEKRSLGAPIIDVHYSADPSTVSSGEQVKFTVKVVNNAWWNKVFLTELTDKTLGENLSGKGNCATHKWIPASSSYECSFTRTITGSPGEQTYKLYAKVKQYGINYSDEDTTTVTIIQQALPQPLSLDLKYYPVPDKVEDPGGTVTFKVEVKNTNNVKVYLYELHDSKFGNVCSTGWIQAYVTYTCQFDEHITGSAGDKHTSVLTAKIKKGDRRGEDQETATVHIVDPPDTGAIEVYKTPDKTSVASGEHVAYTIQVKNKTSGRIKIKAIVDDKFGNLIGQSWSGCAKVGVKKDDTYTCTFTQQVTGTPSKPHVNTVTVKAVSTQDSTKEFTDTDHAEVKFTTQANEIKVTKRADKDSVPSSGEDVTYTITVENIASSKIKIREITDDIFGSLIEAQDSDCIKKGVEKGDTYTCEFTRFVSGQAGTKHKNTVTVEAKAKDGSGDKIVASASEEVKIIKSSPPPQHEEVLVTKKAYPSKISSGDEVKYTITVENKTFGRIKIKDVDDDKFGDLSHVCPVTGIKAGAKYTCTFSKTLYASDFDNGKHQNRVTVFAKLKNGSGSKVFASDSATVELKGTGLTDKPTKPPGGSDNDTPLIEVTTKPVDKKICSGHKAKFTVTITNQSKPNDPVTITSLVEKKLSIGNLNGKGTCSTPQTIDPGKSYMCEYETGQLKGSVGNKEVTRVVAEGKDDEGVTVKDGNNAAVKFVC